MPITRFVCLIGLLLFAATLAQAQRRQLHYSTEVATLTGRLVYKTFYGPPNYGETPKSDSRETQPILILDSKVLVTAKGNNEGDDRPDELVREITLVAEPSNDVTERVLAGKRFSRKRVVVEGSLFHAETGHHHTKVLMEVYTVKKVSRK